MTKGILITLMLALLLWSTPAWAVPTEPVLWGSFFMEMTHDLMPRVEIAGFPFDGKGHHQGVSGVYLKTHCFFCDSLWFPKNAWAYAGSIQPGQVLDIGGRGQFGLDPARFGNTWTIWGITAEPFVAHAGLNTTPFRLFGSVVGPGGEQLTDEPFGYFYHFSGFGTASIVMNGDARGVMWREVSYTLAQSYEPPVSMPEPSTFLLLVSGVGLLWLHRRAYA